jgi:hypothetical protein
MGLFIVTESTRCVRRPPLVPRLGASFFLRFETRIVILTWHYRCLMS